MNAPLQPLRPAGERLPLTLLIDGEGREVARKLGPAMAAGCTSVVKPASATPMRAIVIGRTGRLLLEPPT